MLTPSAAAAIIACWITSPSIEPVQDVPEAAADSLAALRAGFAAPPAEARPDAFWAWLNGHADTARITEEMEAFAAAGFSRLQVWDVKAHRDPDGIVPVGPAFLSDEWLANLAHADREARRLGLELGLVAASGWNAGGTWVPPERAGLSLFSSVQRVQGPLSGEVQLEFPEVPEHSPRGTDGKPAYWETVAIQAIRGDDVQPGSVLELTEKLRDGVLTVELPGGEWELRWFIRANSGQHLIVPSPNSDGLQIDFFDPQDSRWYFEFVLDRLEAGLGPLEESALRYLEVDSLELEGDRLGAWTETILESFSHRYGYDARPWLTLLMEPTRANDTGKRFLHDWSRLVSDLMIENHYRLGNQILARRGLILSAEAGGPGPPIWNSCPVDAIGALGAVGMMRGEFWPKQRSMYNVKEIACAAHTYGERIVDAESFTSWRHWRDLPAYLKLAADQAFLDGLNHITFHTAPHRGSERGVPGYAYHAGTHMGPSVAWWALAKPWIDYLSRCSFLLQRGDHVADVCFYQGDGAPRFHPLGVDWNPRVRPMGFDYDVVDVRQLVDRMEVRDSRFVLPGGASYRWLVLPDSDAIDSQALRKIRGLVLAGGHVVGPRPMRSTGLSGDDESIRALAAELWDSGVGPGRTRVDTRDIKELLSEATPDFHHSGGDARTRIGFVHRRDSDAELYFVVNHNERWERVLGHFRTGSTAAQIWDPVSGEARPAAVSPRGDGSVTVPLELAPGEARFVLLTAEETTEDTVTDLPPLTRSQGSGVDLAHSATPNGPAWLSSGEASPSEEFVVYDLGTTRSVAGLTVWNYQDQVRGLLTRGIKEVGISASTGGESFFPVGPESITKAPDIGERHFAQEIRWEPIDARFLRLHVLSNHSDDWSGHTDVVGLGRIILRDSGGAEIPGVRVHRVSSGTAHHPDEDLVRADPYPGVELTGQWTLQLPLAHGQSDAIPLPSLVSWTDLEDPRGAHASGMGVYTLQFDRPQLPGDNADPIALDLGRLAGVARVTLNGIDCGITWCPPYALDVTAALLPGRNVLRCEVANTWHNRLVGESRLGPEERTTVTNIRGPFRPETPLLEAGILGPVRLTRGR